MSKYIPVDRPERKLDWTFNPSAPVTEEALEGFIEDATSVLLETLNKHEAGRMVLP